MLTTIQEKHRVATAVGAAVQVVLQLAGDVPFTGGRKVELLRELLLRSHAILRSLEEQKQVSDQFQNECGFSPSEFRELLGCVMDAAAQLSIFARDCDMSV